MIKTIRELTGPTCLCGKQMKRRRYWRKWDRVRCKCGYIAECVEVHNGKPQYYCFIKTDRKEKA